MRLNILTEIIKQKISQSVTVKSIEIQDKTFLHKKHKNYKEGKYHLKIIINSEELKKKGRINANRTIFTILKYEIDNFIHSLQISLT